jgi:hypothetical protein
MFFVEWFEILIAIMVKAEKCSQNMFPQLKMFKIAGWDLMSS